MSCPVCGGGRKHVNGCGGVAANGRLDPGLSARVKKAIKDENPDGKGEQEKKDVARVVTTRAFRAQQRQWKKDAADQRQAAKDAKKKK